MQIKTAMRDICFIYIWITKEKAVNVGENVEQLEILQKNEWNNEKNPLGDRHIIVKWNIKRFPLNLGKNLMYHLFPLRISIIPAMWCQVDGKKMLWVNRKKKEGIIIEKEQKLQPFKIYDYCYNKSKRTFTYIDINSN